MLGSDLANRLFLTIPEPQRGELVRALLNGSTEDRVSAVADVLRVSGQAWRDQAGAWIASLLSVESLVPEPFANWRPLVRDAMTFVAAHISDQRLAPKIVEQIELPEDTPPEVRLGILISKTPGLQKLGQVIARARRLSPALRRELQKLENGIADTSVEEVRAIVARLIGPSLSAYKVEMADRLLSEASVSAILEFTWYNPASGRREAGVFKVMKPHVPLYYAEDLRLLQELAGFLGSKGREYYFASREVTETLEEVRLLLQCEVDFRREQATLAEVRRVYQRPGTRTPKPIPELCADTITAMSVERGVKVTEAFPRPSLWRRRLASQIIASLVADPIFSEEEEAIFHADPHAGNLLYDVQTKSLVVLDWALTGRLNREDRRQVGRLILAMTFRDARAVREAIQRLSRGENGSRGSAPALIQRCVDDFFAGLPHATSLGVLDAMRLLDRIALEGVRFPGALLLIRKVLFTLDGVLHDIAGDDVRMDTIITQDFLARLARQSGSLPPPFSFSDYLAVQKSALRYVTGLWAWPE